MSGATQNADGSNKGWKHGKTIVNGEVRFASVSSLETADSSSTSGCLRKWWFRYKRNIKEPPNKDTERGNACHAEVAKYLTTGERGHLSSVVLSGLHQLPTPGDDLLVEWDMVPDLPDGSSGISQAKVRVAGIPLLGAIDLCHARPENYGVQDPSAAYDEPGVIKLLDHKFPNTINNAKSPTDLPETFQMAGYGIFAFETFPDLERVRLTHNYFPTKGTPRAPNILVDRETLERTWRRATAVANSMKHAARESNPDLVDANTRACRAYNRDCPAKVAGVCRAASHSSLSMLVGGTAAARLLTPPSNLVQIGKRPTSPGVLSGTTEELTDMTTPVTPISIIARLQAQRAGAPAPSTVQTPAPTPVPASAPPSADVEAEIVRLAALEAAENAPAPDPTLSLIADIDACGMGRPALSGAVALAYANARRAAGEAFDSNGPFAGTGELAKFMIEDPTHLPAVRDEVRALAAKRAAEIASEAPASDQSSSVETASSEKPPKKPRASRKKADAPSQADHVTEVAASPVVAETPVASIVNVSTPAVAASSVPTEAVTDQPAPGPTPQPPGTINVYVDVAIEGLETKSLWPLIDLICANMNQDAAQPGPDGNTVVTDFRCAAPDSKYGFGRHKGVLAACIRELPAAGLLPPGNYHLNGSMGDIGSVAAETFGQIARATGGVFIKGAR